jgi:hypothetical protein
VASEGSVEVGCPFCGYRTLLFDGDPMPCPFGCGSFRRCPDWLEERSKDLGAHPTEVLEIHYGMEVVDRTVALTPDPWEASMEVGDV